MSYTTLYKVPERGEIETAAEFRNAHGSAPFVWSMLCVARLGWEASGWLLRSMDGVDGVKPLWDLSEDESLPDYERITLMATFDRMMVRRENILRVAAAFRDFVRAYSPEQRNLVCSLVEQAEALEKLFTDPTCFAVCWNQSSMSDTWPRIHEDDDDDDDGRAYDVTIDMGHEFLFDGLVLNGDSGVKVETEAPCLQADAEEQPQ